MSAMCVYKRGKHEHLRPSSSTLTRATCFASFTLRQSRREMRRDLQARLTVWFRGDLSEKKENSHPLRSFQEDRENRENPLDPAGNNSRRIMFTSCWSSLHSKTDTKTSEARYSQENQTLQAHPGGQWIPEGPEKNTHKYSYIYWMDEVYWQYSGLQC